MPHQIRRPGSTRLTHSVRTDGRLPGRRTSMTTGSPTRSDVSSALLAALELNALAPYDTQVACLIALGMVPTSICKRTDSDPPIPLDQHECRGYQVGRLLDLKFLVRADSHGVEEHAVTAPAAAPALDTGGADGSWNPDSDGTVDATAG